MKKLKLNVNAFNKGTVLTREQLKKVLGGSISGSGAPACKEQTECNYFDGTTTEPGECASWGFYDEAGYPHVECFCKTKNHQQPTALGSNGGVSRCNA